ncbi:hypothetical protein GCM10011613_24120 [Cellvibrio zantedeschiae]|uniref:DUF998 domain-containing protein n=1 Tax=Cellvibrio zantedeschiae TaxID=1237077 RepID=A0ABQ3B865_9GAMM|nr:hypothetical protein [Cellvibrio zantedeschiae]GGY78594.1 hypothetical protein GCM10011613_24120 [Cellvibrio zantedeschiae]
MKDQKLPNQSAGTYRTLRNGLALLAFLFPILLALGAYVRAGLPLAGSISEYYHYFDPVKQEYGRGLMRDLLVGLLCGQAALLFVYKGFTRLEDYALNIAGIAATGLALFPMRWPAPSAFDPFSTHGVFAAIFFISIAYVCIWRANDTLHLIVDEKVRKSYARIYKLLGILMLVLPALVWAWLYYLPLKKSLIFFIEMGSVYTFATYWVLKSREAKMSGLDEQAATGNLSVPDHSIKDMFRELPVQHRE